MTRKRLPQRLKAAINQARPARARKADPGMPSSHANALAFLATSAAVALLQGPGGGLRGGGAALAVLPLAGAAFLVRALPHRLLCRLLCRWTMQVLSSGGALLMFLATVPDSMLSFRGSMLTAQSCH